MIASYRRIYKRLAQSRVHFKIEFNCPIPILYKFRLFHTPTIRYTYIHSENDLCFISKNHRNIHRYIRRTSNEMRRDEKSIKKILNRNRNKKNEETNKDDEGDEKR